MESEQALLNEARFYGTLRDAPSGAPDASGRVSVVGRSHPVNLAPRLCNRHRGHEFWDDSGRIVCGLCHPPGSPTARFLRDGGPAGRPHVELNPSDWPPPSYEVLKAQKPRRR